MAELVFEAPLANFDTDEWNEFHDFQEPADIDNNPIPVTEMSKEKPCSSKIDTIGIDTFTDSFSLSLEDLVNSLDEKITKCFSNYEDKVENFAPVQLRKQEEIVNECQMWWTITGNFGNILPIDWSKTYARELQTQSLNLPQKRERESPDLDLSDDEEVKKIFDIHSLVTSHHQTDDEPMITADEVIHEIEGLMEDSPSPEGSPTQDIMALSDADFLQLKRESSPHDSNYEESFSFLEDPNPEIQANLILPVNDEYTNSLRLLSNNRLNVLLEELESAVREYSEVLISELAHRDELEYDKELKNQFISLLLSVQKKRKEMLSAARRRAMRGNLNTPTQKKVAGAPEPGKYLTTVVPYHPNSGPPTIQELQIYIKILKAVNEDSPAVPGLLTDYILKVLCPT